MVLFEKLELHNELNPILWNDDETLKEEVRDRLLEIIKKFVSYCDIDFKVLDAQLVGSNASYNYNSQSDIDVHLIVNFDSLDASQEIVQAFFNLEKSSFNKALDISIHGLSVELYVEDLQSTSISNGRYSIIKDKWIKHPVQIEVEDMDTTEDVIDWQKKINDAVESGDSEEMQSVIDSLYLMRKNSISTDGEYGYGNQVFKDLRGLGELDYIKEERNKVLSKELTLESMRDKNDFL